MRARILLTLTSLLIAPLLLAQQPPQQPTTTIQVTTRLVTLDAVVLDRNNVPQSDLTRDDFRITEDDQPQTIRDFDAPGSFLPPASVNIHSTAQLDQLAPNAPVNLILLDDFNTRFEDQAFARHSLEQWLKQQPEHLDTPTMLIAVSLRSFTVLQDYTQQTADIFTALDHHFAGFPWQQSNSAWIPERYSAAFLSLTRICKAVAGHPGHKNLIWIGRGFPTIDRSRFNSDSLDRLDSFVRQSINQLRDSRVTLYTVDPTGVAYNYLEFGEGSPIVAPFNGEADFQSIARATGGRNLFGRNDVDREIGSAIQAGSAFYTLTYRPTSTLSDPAHLRRIRVTVTRPGLTVATRQGYYADRPTAQLPSPATPSGTVRAGRTLAQDFRSAETSNMVYDAVALTLQPSPTQPNTLLIHIPAASVPWTATSPRQCRVVLLVSTFDRKGRQLSRHAQSMTADAPPDSPSAGPIAVPINIPYPLTPEPHATRVRVVVRIDSTGQMGTADLSLP